MTKLGAIAYTPLQRLAGLIPKRIGLRTALTTSLGYFASADRHQFLTKAVCDWLFMAHNRLPVAYLAELWPDIANIFVNVRLGISHRFELPYGERVILSALVTYLRPRTTFEFGTFTGATAALLADAGAPDAVVHTLDLPPDQIVWGAGTGDPVGMEFRDEPKYRDRIIQHRSDTAVFEFRDFKGQVDVVFIDAAHDYDSVLRDSGNALEMLAPEGVIVWDDYQPSAPDVVLALNELAESLQLVRIAHTRLVIHRREPFPGVSPHNLTPWDDQ